MITKRRRSGVTLVEMLVAVTVFLLLNGAVLAMLHYNQRAAEKATATADANTQALLVFEKIRQELRRGRVVEQSPDLLTLGYWLYQLDAGQPIFGGPHGLVFLPGLGQPPDLAEMTAVGAGGRLVRRFQGQEETLTRIGRDGEVKFEWEAGLQRLRVQGTVGEKNANNPASAARESVKTFRFTIPLNNIE